MSNLVRATEALEQFNRDFRRWLDGNKSGDMTEFLRMYYRVTEQYELLDGARKELNAMLEGVSRNYIPEIVLEKQVKTITLEDIKRRFTVATRISCSLLDKDRGFQWLRENNAGDLIQPTVNSSALSSYAKNYIETTGKDLPPALFKISTMNYTSVTKVK